VSAGDGRPSSVDVSARAAAVTATYAAFAAATGRPRTSPPSLHPSSPDCALCHAPEAGAWSSSHHALASGTDLHPERFDGRPQSFGALRVTPERRSGRPVFRVRDGAGERLWEVIGTIGVAPLQQYLLAHTRGRVLVAPVAWDLAASRWFDPAPDGAVADPKDALYWAGMAGNWNHLCGECHTTGYDKSYRRASDSYASHSVHPVVACEACHGVGQGVVGLRDGGAQLRACTPCHSRHETLGYGGGPSSELLDSVRPALIDNIAFEADGRNSAPEEPFEWGAFSQSKMYRIGVRCSDCHDPHTARTRGEGDAVCGRCHTDAAIAAQHAPGTDSSACIQCHMPIRTYMGIDERHDHGLRVPGPGALGATWAAARAGDPSAGPMLRSLALDRQSSPFVRASAVAALRSQRPEAITPLRGLLGDPDALVRAEATETLAVWGDVPVASLSDPSRAVRFSALKAIVLMGARPALDTRAFAAVREELEATLQTHGDLAGTWQNVGAVREVMRDAAGALQAYEAALQLDPASGWLAERVQTLQGAAAAEPLKTSPRAPP
jgi:predicted CXXCH cytochrome family protein